MKTADFDYPLPPERIAQTPVEPRDASRLLVLARQTGELTHTHFNQITDYLKPGDLLVVNQTRVIPARLYARKAQTGGKLEVLLLKRRSADTWEALIGGKGMVVGKGLALENGIAGEVIEVLDGAKRVVRFAEPIEAALAEIGHVPLPPYIHTLLSDPERYQTVYAQQAGSAAAPTAGLHFTQQLLAQLATQGVGLAQVTLHVGLDTFAPVTEDDPLKHHIHTEWCQMDAATAEQINTTRANGGRIVAVGTTSVRVLESAARQTARQGTEQVVAPFEGATDLFIFPGYQYRAVDALITNFHLPRSTLLMLVSAFASHAQIMYAYQTAIEEEYRFYSFGDAMFIW